MVLRYLMADAGLAKSEITEGKTETKQAKTKKRKRGLICLLLLAYLIVANTGYNFWVAEENTPVWKLLTASVVYDLWTAKKNTVTKPGVVAGILYSSEDSCALVNREIVYEGETTNGVKVVKIHRTAVEFEKGGMRWTQKVLANPNHAWKQQDSL